MQLSDASRLTTLPASLFLAPFCLSLLAVACVDEGSISPAVFAVACLLIGWGLLSLALYDSANALRTGMRMFTAVYLSTLILTCVTYEYYLKIYGTPYESGGTDDFYFENTAFTVLSSQPSTYEEFKAIVADHATGTWHVAGNYVMAVAVVHGLAEFLDLKPSTLNPRIVNCLLLGLAAVLAYRLACRCCVHERSASWAGYLVGLFPGTAFCAAHIYRDVAVGFGLLLVVNLTLSILDDRDAKVSWNSLQTLIKLVVLACGCFTLCSLREGLYFVTAAMIMGAVAARSQRWLLVGGAGILLAVAAASVFPLHELAGQARQYMDYYTEYRSESGDASGLGTGIYRLPIMFSIPLRVVYASVNPLPLPTLTLTEDFRRSGTVIWFLCLPFLLHSLRRSLSPPQTARDRNLQAVALAFTTVYLQVAIITMQARHVTMFVPFGGVLIAYGAERNKGPVLGKLLAMTIIGTLLGFVYNEIKGF